MRLAAIQAAVTSRDADALRTAAHALKGAAGNLSADRLFEAARVLERIGAEWRMDAVDDAWRLLSIEAHAIIKVLGRYQSTSVPAAILARILNTDSIPCLTDWWSFPSLHDECQVAQNACQGARRWRR